VIRFLPEAWEELRRHGEETYPHESCGVLLGVVFPGTALPGAALPGSAADSLRSVTLAIRCGNERLDQPERRYAIDPRELLRAQKIARERGEEIVGFYHSHPDHPARPSATDLAEAHWLGCAYVITRVASGRAEATGSFLLAGTGEEDKRFVEEEVRTEPAARAPEIQAPLGGSSP